ncbi:MAG: Phospholipase precursor [Pseudomonadota bacterium]|jgi:predicted peroxiredoxin
MSVEVKFEKLHVEVQKEISNAKKSLLIAVAWINFSLYSDILRRLKNDGVKIKILCTDSSSNSKQIELINSLRNEGINIHLCSMPSQVNHMHHKFVIIDDSIIINGSFNWSKNAEKSFENIIIIKNDPALINSFVDEFYKIDKLNKAAIKSLQTLSNCSQKNCDRKMANIIVFQSAPIQMTFEIWGDFISCCSVCGEDNYLIIHRGIQDTQLHSFFSRYDTVDLNEKEILQFDRAIDLYLTGYTVCDAVVHGIGFVHRELLGRNDEIEFTKIIWKNKFVLDAVRDTYDTTFNVSYE